MSEKKHLQIIRGIVVGASMPKTRVIELQRTKQHRLYLKKQVGRVKLLIHDEKNQSKVGDSVLAAATRPISGKKRFRLTKIVEEGTRQ